jgi:prevent-host-death family protein
MRTITIHEAKTHLSRLIRRALEGEDIIISRGRDPLVRLVPVKKPRPARIVGDYKGRIRIAEDFDEPLEDLADYR